MQRYRTLLPSSLLNKFDFARTFVDRYLKSKFEIRALKFCLFQFSNFKAVLGLILLFPILSSTTKSAETFPTNCQLFIPNVFSPNADGVNDLFLPQTDPDCSLTDYELIVMDRWGGVLFQTNNVNDGWNGEYEGQQMEDGTYVYNIEYSFVTTDTLGSPIELKHGEINLVR